MSPTPRPKKTSGYLGDGRAARYAAHNLHVRTLILNYVGTFLDTYRYSPSREEISDALTANGTPISTAAVSKHLNWLEANGYVERGTGTINGKTFPIRRSLRLTAAYASGNKPLTL